MNEKEKIISSGVLAVKPDKRNYSASKFGATTIVYKDFNLDAGFGIPDQRAVGMPNGCTGFTQSELCQDEDKRIYQPYYTYHKGLFIMNAPDGQPVDMKSSLKSTVVYGVLASGEATDAEAAYHIRGAYYQVEKQGDWFDSIISQMSEENGARTVSMATPWYSSFVSVGINGVISPLFSSNYSLHNWKACGVKMIDGTPFIIGKPWQGTNYGDGGYVYFSRDIINRLLNFYGAGAFIVAPYDSTKIDPVKMEIYKTILSYLYRLFTYFQSNTVTPSVKDVPQNDYQEVKDTVKDITVPNPVPKTNMIQKWASGIAKFEGAAKSLNNPGNFKWSTLIDSFGGKKGPTATDGGSFAQFDTYDKGFNALYQFLTLGCKNELKAYHNARTIKQFTLVYTNFPPTAYDYSNRLIQYLGVTADTNISAFL